jgi:hypothetical protein
MSLSFTKVEHFGVERASRLPGRLSSRSFFYLPDLKGEVQCRQEWRHGRSETRSTWKTKWHYA